MRSVITVLFVCALNWNPLAAQDFKLDHFKFYKIDVERPTDTTISVRGQFDKEPRKIRIVGPALFANVVSKNKEKIIDERAHLTSYFIRRGGAEPARTVQFKNQFGEQKAALGRAELFLAPSGKVYKRENTSRSKSLEHFKCYRVERSETVNRKVLLVDQFTKEENVAVRPVFFCVPVEKEHNGRITKIQNERDHLVIYELEIHTSKPTYEIGTIDQFDDLRGEVYTVMWLGVPSAKLAFEVRD